MTKKNYKKTIRFDAPLYYVISDISKKYNFKFSKTVKALIYYCLFSGKFDDKFKILDDDDKQLLYKILVLYARSASNINQSAHALNELKSLSWLDLNQQDLMNQLNYISLELKKVDDDFQNSQEFIEDFSNKIDGFNKKRGH